ncbi:hydrogenase maturation protease [Candidatus Methanomassiliicoccus intestinalis]|uniref:hydrogenase maturation protease n=1 Tax=Candidatus Methanomassiliicoccus intestinalis TaxID=1406512 RepID=UPI0037DDBF17
MKTLVLGIGSPIMSDDAIGLRTLAELEKMNLENVTLEEACTSGLDLIEIMIGYDRVIIIDAIMNYADKAGTVMVLDSEAFSNSVHGVNAHEANIPSTIALGRKIAPDDFPKDIKFVAVEVNDVFTVNDHMTPEVEAALPEAVNVVLKLINE